MTSSVLAAIPPVVLVPLLILWLGFGDVLPVAASAIAALVPISYNLLSAAANVDPGISDYLATLRMGTASRLEVLSRILMPHIFPGLRLSANMAWRVCFVVEMLAVPSGLGHIAFDAAGVLDVSTVIAAVLLLVASSYVHQALIDIMGKTLYERWGSVQHGDLDRAHRRN